MSGITDLSVLIGSMKPSLDAEDYVYCVVEGEMPDRYLSLRPIGFFREEEGLTLILSRAAATEAGLPASAPMRRITLTVHSALEAVGLTAALAAALTRENISANVVAAYYHDHFFIPSADADRAMAALTALAASATSDRGQ